MPHILPALNKYDFTDLVKNHKHLGESEANKLRDLVKEYPYFSLANNLLVKALHETKHYEYDRYLKQAALLTGNRTVLYNLVHNLPLETEASAQENGVVEEMEISIMPEPTKPIEMQEAPALDNLIPEEPLVVAETITTAREEEPSMVEIPETENFFGTETRQEPPAVEEIPVVEKVESNTVELIETPIVEEFAKPTEETTNEPVNEELVKPSGRYVKFTPKAKPINEDDEHSLIDHVDEIDEEVLIDFDISSLDDLGGLKATPIYVEDEPKQAPESTAIVESEEILPDPLPWAEPKLQPEPEPEPELELKPVPEPLNLIDEALVDLPEPEEIKPIEVTLPEPVFIIEENPVEAQIAEEPLMENSINEEIEVEEPKIDIEEVVLVQNIETNIAEEKEEVLPVAEIKPTVIEDTVFVDSFTQAFAKSSNQKLEETIVSHIAPEPIPANQPEPTLSEKENLLSSLENYEVDLFMAQAYKRTQFDAGLFEGKFYEAFPGAAPVKKPVEKPVERIAPAPKVPEIVIPKILDEEKPREEKPKKEEAPKQVNTERPIHKYHRDPATVESILDKFIRENPSIARPKSEFYNPVNMARQSAESDEELVSETLASILLRQGHHKKAIIMYEKLGLLYPDKLAYFAGLIQKIKTENNLD